MADYSIEKFMNKIIGKAEVDDALRRLDFLTREENFTITPTRNLEEHFDDEATIVQETFEDVHDNVRATQEVFCDVGSDVKETNLDVDVRSVNDNVKAPESCMSHPFNFLMYVLIFSIMWYNSDG